MSDYPRCKNCVSFRANWFWIPMQGGAACTNPKTIPSKGLSRYHLGKAPKEPTPNLCSSERAPYGNCGPEGKLFERAEEIRARLRCWLPVGWDWLWAAAWAVVFVILFGGTFNG